MRRWLQRQLSACAWRAAPLLVLVGVLRPVLAGPVDCGDPPVTATVTVALFSGGDAGATCDANADGMVTAADVTTVVLSLVVPSRSPTAEPTADPSPTRSPQVTPTPTVTATPTGTATMTPTPRACPNFGSALQIQIDNQSGVSPVSIVVSGARTGQECRPGSLSTSYEMKIECTGTGVVTCGQLDGLAPGWWRHSIDVKKPRKGQMQHQTSLLVAGDTPDQVRFTVFASVRSVRTTANAGAGSLRAVLQAAMGAPKPVLVQFGPTAFPPGVSTTIHLKSQLPVLAGDDVTIDGTDASGAVGNRIIDADGLPIGALAITGGRNHIIGLRLRNSGGNNRDILNISGPAADGNIVERSIIEGPGSADGIGVDRHAGKDFRDTVNLIRDCEVTGVSDKGIKVTTGAYARIERCWVHDNANGGIQATLGGHVQAWHNVVERNRGSAAQNGLSANARDGADLSGFSELDSWGNIARGNGANGVSVRGFSFARLRDDYLATNGAAGLRVFNDVGAPATAIIEGTSAVCNGVDGAVVADASRADLGGGAFGSPGNNAFAQNNLPVGGANLRNATSLPVSAVNDQWEHCGRETTCNDAAIAGLDLSDHGAHTTFVPPQAHRSQRPPTLLAVAPTKGREGELLRIFGTGFNVIDGHFSEDKCADVVGRNRCVPLRGNCVQVNGVSAPVEAVTPTMLVVRWPFTCLEPAELVVKTDQGATGATSLPITVCTNGAPVPR
ncbi:MAG: right-handed parallel beta-helix repeat-containing protein [Candidatus Binatia bacterium]